jgi:hypothetical protein
MKHDANMALMKRHMGRVYKGDKNDSFLLVTGTEYTDWIANMHTNEPTGLATVVEEYERLRQLGLHAIRVPLARLLRILSAYDPITQLVRHPAPAIVRQIAQSDTKMDAITSSKMFSLCPFISHVINAYYNYGDSETKDIPQCIRQLFISIADAADNVLNSMRVDIPVQETFNGEYDRKDNKYVR